MSSRTIVVAGSLVVDPADRASYLESCREAVTAAREADGCLDFAVSADLVDAGRINVFERWESEAALLAFRGSGPDDGQLDLLHEIRVGEYDATERGG